MMKQDYHINNTLAKINSYNDYFVNYRSSGTFGKLLLNLDSVTFIL